MSEINLPTPEFNQLPVTDNQKPKRKYTKRTKNAATEGIEALSPLIVENHNTHIVDMTQSAVLPNIKNLIVETGTAEKIMDIFTFAIPPVLFKRNEFGLIDNGRIKYIFKENGLVDWKAMINPAFIVPNKRKTTETDITKLKEQDLIIKLGAMKELAFLRGFSSVSYDVISASGEYAAVKCRIIWLPNYETPGFGVTFESVADATLHNTDGFGVHYLVTMAENRAFARCVRNFLQINIVTEEEVSDVKLPVESNNDDPTSPKVILAKLMEEKKLKFEDIKTYLSDIKYEKVDEVKSLDDVPKLKIFELIERIQS